MFYHGAVRISDSYHEFYISAIALHRYLPVESDIKKVIEACHQVKGSFDWRIAWFTQVFLTGKCNGTDIGLELSYDLCTGFQGNEDHLYFVRRVEDEWKTTMFRCDEKIVTPCDFNERDIDALKWYNARRWTITQPF